MTNTRAAWWNRARWFFLLFALVGCTAAFADPAYTLLQGWRVALLLSSIMAAVGTAGGVLVLTGRRPHGYHVFAQLEFWGFGGVVLFETLHGMYVLYLAWVTRDWSLVARASAHVALAVAVGLSYRNRPLRERSVRHGVR